MSFPTKEWHNRGSGLTPTPYDAPGMNDLEKRISDAFKNLVEFGESQNIHYAKYDNGLLECWGEVNVGVIGENNPSFNRIITLPVSYKDTSYAILTSSNGKGARWSFVNIRGNIVSKNSCNIGAYYNGTSGETESEFGVYFETVGFWK